MTTESVGHAWTMCPDPDKWNGTNGTMKGVIQWRRGVSVSPLDSLLGLFLPWPNGIYHGSNPWCNVAKNLIDQYEHPKRLVPASAKNPAEVHRLLDKLRTCNKHPVLLHTGTPGSYVPLQRPSSCSQRPCEYCARGSRPQPSEVRWGTLERRAAA